MKFTRAFGAMVVATLAVGACADQADMDDDTGIPPAEETTLPEALPEPADDLPEQTVQFTSVGDSPITGEVEIDDDDGRTELDVRIRNATAGSVHQGHIHTGTCDAPGDVVAPLADINVGDNGEGTSENDLDIPMMTVMNGQHIVAFHEAGGDPGAPVVCAAIPAHQM